MKKFNDNLKKTFMILLSLMIVSAVCSFSVLAKDGPTQRTVRVGFFSSDGYHEMNDDGIMSGYGYDFLQMLLRYDDWKYEYIGYDLNWGDMLDMLDRGEIDMVTLANKTPEREKKFDYSTEPIGTSSTIMTIAADNTEIIPGDYSTYDRAVIGLVEGSSHNKKFEEYAAEKGFHYTPVYYEDIADLLEDLRNHNQIQIGVTSNMRVVHREMILDEFNQTDYYAIVKKGNTQLLDDINQAINQMDVYSPEWRSTLFQKYYSNINSEVISFSPEERAYLAELASSGTVIKAAMNPELKPYSYFENGEAKGIVPELFEKIASQVGISYEILYSEDRMEYKHQLSTKEADLDLTAFQDYGIAQQYHLKETSPYLTTYLTMLSHVDSSKNMDKLIVAAVNNPTEYASYNHELLEQQEKKEYRSLAECCDAVKKGDADLTYLYAYSAEQVMAEDYAHKLKATIMPDYTFGLTIGVQNEKDHRLLSVLDKSVHSLSNSYVSSVCLKEITAADQNISLIAIVYSHPFMTAFLCILIVGLIWFVLFLSYVNRNKHRQVLTNIKLNRFIRYSCENYDLVTEMDLKNRTRTDYTIVDGQLVETSYPYVPLVREDYEKIAHEEDIDKILAVCDESHMKTLIDAGEGQDYYEVQVKDQRGQYRWYSYLIRAIKKDEEHPCNYIMFKQDIQDRKDQEAAQQQNLKDALEAAKSASEAKGQFLSRMSHEIRTPLNAVIGYMGIAEDADGDMEKVMHCVKNSETAAQHLLSIINDVLDISSIESGRMKIAHEDFNLKEIITNVSTLFYNQAVEKGVNFEAVLNGITQEGVVGDKLRLNQILMNLLSNALKFTPEHGTCILAADQIRKEDGKVFYKFSVSDTGIGMSEEFMARLFLPFEQENASIAQRYGGTGLGMSITYNLVEMMGGRITVDSKLNCGSTFTVTLHFDVSELTVENDGIQQDFSKIRVLVVDDVEEECSYIKSTLKRCGVKSDTVTDGKLALKRLRSRAGTDYSYDLCIIDWKMPDMNGIEVAENIRKEFGSELPLIIATAYDTLSIETEAKAAGVNQIVTKPLFQSTLCDLLMDSFGTQKLKTVQAKPQKENLEGVHILLAEDNEMNMEIAVTVLEKAGVTVDKAMNGQEAVDIFLKQKAGTYQLILMDIQMPVMNGYEATRAIRKSDHPEAATIPVIAMTANAFAEDIAEALANGMNAHIAKPVDYAKLYAVMEQYCVKDDVHQ